MDKDTGTPPSGPAPTRHQPRHRNPHHPARPPLPAPLPPLVQNLPPPHARRHPHRPHPAPRLYRCPHDKSIPRHAAAHPGHPSVTVREDDLMTALAGFFSERVFGPDRAAMLAAALPASAAEQAAQRQDKAAALRKQLARIDTAENALITELEAPASRATRPPRPCAADPRPLHRPVHRTDPDRSRAQPPWTRPPRRTTTPPCWTPCPSSATSSPGPRPPDRTAPGRVRRQAVYSNDLHQVTITPPSPTPHPRPSAACSPSPAPIRPHQRGPPRPPPKILFAIRQRTREYTQMVPSRVPGAVPGRGIVVARPRAAERGRPEGGRLARGRIGRWPRSSCFPLPTPSFSPRALRGRATGPRTRCASRRRSRALSPH